MDITINHCRYAPKWDTLQQMIREATADGGQLTRINRKDGGCNYSAPGEYRLDFLQDNSTILPINLTIKAVGKR